MIDPEDKNLVCKFIVLDNTLKLLMKELDAIEMSKIKIKKPHYNFILGKIEKGHKELQQLHKHLRSKGIHIQEMRKDEFSVEYPFTCRGYFDTQIMQRDVLKNNMVEKLRELYS
ncbi:hypothetical protein ACNQFZ_06900 [Schinkia sp. CFF1]